MDVDLELQQADHGLGTTFERFAIYTWLERIARQCSAGTVLEGPGDGIAGIRGIHGLGLARTCHVTVVLHGEREIDLARQAWAAQGRASQVAFARVDGLPLPFPSRQFDLVWNFNRLPFYDPAAALLGEMVRLSRRYVALVVPNRRNYAFPARRLYHRRTRLPWPYGDTRVMAPRAVCDLMQASGLRPLEVQWLDVPWWPDLLDPAAWLEVMLPGSGRLFSRTRRDGYCWTPEQLPYFDPHTYADLHARMRRLGWLGKVRPSTLQVPFAHHFAVLGIRQDTHA